MNKEPKHLEIMVEMQRDEAGLRRSRSALLNPNFKQTVDLDQELYKHNFIRQCGYVSPEMSKLIKKAETVENNFQERMAATGGEILVTRPLRSALLY